MYLGYWTICNLTIDEQEEGRRVSMGQVCVCVGGGGEVDNFILVKSPQPSNFFLIETKDHNIWKKKTAVFS